MHISRIPVLVTASIGFVLATSALPAAAQQLDQLNLFRLQSLPGNTRTITTYGSAEINVVPDKVRVVVSVKTFDKTLSAARAVNDQSVKKILDLANKYKIDASDVQTTQVSIDPVYPDNQGSYHSYTTSPIAKPTGYSLQQTIGFIVRKTEMASSLISDALDAGANSIQSVTYETSELRKHRDKARLEALQAAREKAQALAAESGLKLSKPLHIQEEGAQASPSGMFANVVAQNAYLSPATRGGAGNESEGGLALGRIAVRSGINVIFELTE